MVPFARLLLLHITKGKSPVRPRNLLLTAATCLVAQAAGAQSPPVARIIWDSRPLVRRIVNWAANVSQGKPDLGHTHTPAKYLSGGTVGPVRK